MGDSNVMSRSRQSSTEYLGSPRVKSVREMEVLPVKSYIGEKLSNSSLRPSSRNNLEESSCNSTRLGISTTWEVFFEACWISFNVDPPNLRTKRHYTITVKRSQWGLTRNIMK